MMEPIRTGQDEDSVVGIGNLWSRQEDKYEFDYKFYNSIPWLIIKTVFALSIISLTFLLYGLHEIPWNIYGSATGLIILLLAPMFAGMIIGYSFEKPKWALAYSVIIGFAAIGLSFLIMILPFQMDISFYGPGFMSNIWWYGYYLPFMITISCVPTGAMLAVSTNVYD